MKNKLTNKQRAIIATIHQEPKYLFKYDELEVAKRLEKRKILKRINRNQFKITKFGEKIYNKYNFSIEIDKNSYDSIGDHFAKSMMFNGD